MLGGGGASEAVTDERVKKAAAGLGGDSNQEILKGIARGEFDDSVLKVLTAH